MVNLMDSTIPEVLPTKENTQNAPASSPSSEENILGMLLGPGDSSRKPREICLSARWQQSSRSNRGRKKNWNASSTILIIRKRQAMSQASETETTAFQKEIWT
ncbi:hypothetical protein TNIN_104801 [Trichonephila inaurata madagascariensis]|uniref:Uncharacterized protein n=1 Tax=Trichonephila inaurata madagascariensis TaxID=2747483 RepID=A0A8X6X620_9ARAC|nr:hypothetical protein TNIN_104801 [Trichonephila inaurata madagascariensis]